ncbi:MAG: hypothetical protein HYZ42_02820 [Bacteroidetes bacterium]|nr:hypothetical protein [Bacteroidota bacterium]
MKFIYIVFVTVFLSSCLGSKKDKTVDEIFEQGRIDPKLVPTGVGYVPVQPYFNGFNHPMDVLVGFDELIYVVDEDGLHILDQAGRKQQKISFKGATDVTQDRRLHTYVAATVDITIGGNTKNVAAIYHLINTAIGQYQIIDTLIHPFCDESRLGSGFRSTDEQVRFTGLACTADNRLYVSRTGSENKDPIANPDNTILIFDKDGKYVGYTNGLNPSSPSLKSVLGISAIATFSAPPQRVFGMNPSFDILLTQADPRTDIEFRTLWIKQTYDIDLGEIFSENSSLLSFDTSKADNFLYKPYRFKNPQDIYIAPDQTNYIFIVDADSNKLFQFTNKGYEGVNPAATSGLKKQQLVSFGSLGEGPLQFNQPSGVCYFKRMVYVADKMNNRICRFKLSTDLE